VYRDAGCLFKGYLGIIKPVPTPRRRHRYGSIYFLPHRKIELVLSLDKRIVEVSKKLKNNFFSYFKVLSVIFSFLRKSQFFRKLSISACCLHDIRNLLIKSNKNKLRVLPPLPFIAGGTFQKSHFFDMGQKN
jgi:hypothetical protein